MKERARVGAPPLLKSKTVIIERGLVDIRTGFRKKTAAIGPQYGDVVRREVKELPKLQLLLPDFLFRTPTLCNVLARDQDNRIVPPKDGSGRFANLKHRAILAHFAELPTHRLAELFQAEGDISLNRLAIRLIKNTEHRQTD